MTIRSRPRFLGAAALLLLGAGAPAAAQAPSAQGAPARADQQVAAGDVAGARATLDAALRQAPNDYEALWRASRVAVLAGDGQREGSPEQAQSYQRALDLANQAVKANPQGPDGYVRRAAAGGKVALSKGVLQSAEYVKNVRADAEKALALGGPPHTRAAAHYILGRTNVKLAETPRPLRMPLGLQWGTLADGVTHLRKAAELRPDFVMYRLDLARALDRDGKRAEARQQLEQVPRIADAEPGDDARKREAAQLLASLR